MSTFLVLGLRQRLLLIAVCAALWAPSLAAQKALPKKTLNPTRALWMSFACPGAGQIYNHQAWKTPVVAGTLLAMGYYVYQQNKIYGHLTDALNHIRHGDGSPTGLLGEREDLMVINRDIARRNRDFLLIISALLYALQGVEALVSAHLHDFNVTPAISHLSLSLSLKPYLTFAPTPTKFHLIGGISARIPIGH